MVGEATSGLSLAQSVVYDEVERLLQDWAIYELGEKDMGKKNDAHDYVYKNWGLEVADYPQPTLKDFDKMLDYFQSHNKVERRGQNVGIKGL